ncbi:MAG: integrase core domain-containing protein [Coriobacteriia bacterium]
MVIRARKKWTKGDCVAGPFSYSNPMPLSCTRARELPPPLSKEARRRLSWMDFYHTHGCNAALTCRHFAIPRSTFYRWLQRFDPYDKLEDRSKAPRRRREPTTPMPVVDAIVKLRDERPAWSKYKLSVVLERDFGIIVSASTVGRVLKRYGRIDKKKSLRRVRAAKGRNQRKRRPKDLTPSPAGELVQIDTKHLNLPWSEKRFHFEAIDLATRMKVSGIAKSDSSRSAEAFLAHALSTFPFPVQAVQTDNGSEYAHLFEKACEAAGIPHYLSYPRCPKQNAWVERVIQTTQNEYYLYHEIPAELSEHVEMCAWLDRDYNEVRPHQSLGYLTPLKYYRRQAHEHRTP